MAPFDRPCTTFYWSANVNIALYYTVCELFNVEWYRDLEIWVSGHSRSLKLAPIESLRAVFYSPFVVTMALYCIILEIKRYIGQKSWFFHIPLYSTAPLGGFPSDYCLPVWFEITIMMGLLDGEKGLTICLPVLTEYFTNVTDRQTDTHTDTAWRRRPRLMQASRGNNRTSRITIPRRAVSSEGLRQNDYTFYLEKPESHSQSASGILHSWYRQFGLPCVLR